MPDSFTEMRRRNAVRVLELIRQHGELSRADIARMTDLSKATVSSITAELLDSDLLRETGSISTEKGRKPTGLVFNAIGKIAVGVALDDQSNLIVALTDMDGNLLKVESDKTAPDINAGHIINRVKQALLTEKLQLDRVCSIGVAAPGPLQKQGGRYAELAQSLRQLTDHSVFLESLVDMAAIAESHQRELPHDRFVAFLRTSHALRSTLLLGRRPIFLHGELGGDPGHIVAPWIHETCACGNVGCTNAHVGGKAVLQRAAQQGVTAADIDELVVLCNRGNPVAQQVITDAGRATGYVVACIINMLAPITVIVSGGLTAAGESFWQPLRQMSEKHSTSGNFLASDIQASSLGPDSAALGAALHALHNKEIISNNS